jgi:signal transduction histidine kinase
MSRVVRWYRRLDAIGRDRLLAVAAAALCEFELLITGAAEGPLGLNMLVIAALTLPLALRRQHTIAVAVWIMAMAVVQSAWLTPVESLVSPYLLLLLNAYSVAAYLHQPTAAFGLLVCLAGISGVNVVMDTATAGDYFFPGMFAVIAWLCGRAVRVHTRLTEELHEAAVRAREAGEEHARSAVAAERRRIAREMHDVVAHSVSVMVVQAGGARRILDRDPARAVEAAARIEETGRAAMVEMRGLLGILHAGDEHAAALAPQPTLRNLAALVANAREAGLPVELREEGEPRSLPAGVDLAAYRVVQEALTNAIKHAGAAPTEVAVRWGETHLELEIVDRGAPADEVNGSGHGLVGMEERMRLYDGELRTGRRDGGGFEVIARLPL